MNGHMVCFGLQVLGIDRGGWFVDGEGGEYEARVLLVS